MGFTSYLAFNNWGELLQPFNQAFTLGNLAIMWITLIGLKIVHEFGHAYACKNYGGHVPEMGLFLVVFTPLAYMDATASWGFSRKQERLIVCMGGLFVESALSSVALIIWSVTEPSTLNSVAYNVFFLAGVTTILMNLNPLMKYDGYYAFCDLLEIPNLRQRANNYLIATIKWLSVGVKNTGGAQMGLFMKVFLFIFGLSTAIYKITIVLAISVMIAMKFFLIGLLLGFMYVFLEVSKLTFKSLKWLWWSPEAAPVRVRAIGISIVVITIIPAIIILAPVPVNIIVSGILVGEREEVVYAETPGYIKNVRAVPGDQVKEGSPLLKLDDTETHRTLVEVESKLAVSELKLQAYQAQESYEAKQEERRIKFFREEVEARRSDLLKLNLRSTMPGKLVKILPKNTVGRFINIGEPLATIISGKWTIQALLSEKEFASVQPVMGQTVEFRSTADTAIRLHGTITRISPTGSNKINVPSLTHLGGGSIPVNPQTREAASPYFTVQIILDDIKGAKLFHGMTGRVKFVGISETIGRFLYRKVLQFTNRLR